MDTEPIQAQSAAQGNGSSRAGPSACATTVPGWCNFFLVFLLPEAHPRRPGLQRSVSTTPEHSSRPAQNAQQQQRRQEVLAYQRDDLPISNPSL